MLARADDRIYSYYKILKRQGKYKSFPEFQRDMFRAWKRKRIVAEKIDINLPKWF